MSKRALGSVAAVVAGLALVPSAVFADQQGPYTGNATTATLTVQVSPTALLTVPSSLIPAQVSSTLGTALDPVTIQVDSAHASATRSGTAADLSTAHGDVTPVSIDVKALGTLLDELSSSLDTLTKAISLPALASTLSDVASITADSTVMALLPANVSSALTSLQSELSSLTTELAALPDVDNKAVDDLRATLVNQLSAALSLKESLVADLDSSHPIGQNTTQPSLVVPSSVSLPADVPQLPVVAQLSPFSATAVNLAGAQHYGVSGAQGAANESTDSINVTPAVDLSALRSAVSTLQATLQQVTDSIATLTPLLTSAVNAILAPVLPGGLDLSTLSTQANAALAVANSYLQFVTNLDLNSLLHCDALGAGACSIASTSVTPEGTGLHAVASSKLIDLSVLPMDDALATALAPLGATAGKPLLDVQGVQATTDAVIAATGYTAPTATGTIAKIVVAGTTVVDQSQVDKTSLTGHLCPGTDVASLPDAIPVGQPLSICMATPASGSLTVVITSGAPQYTNTGPTHRSASLSMLEVRLVNGDASGNNRITQLGATNAGPIATVDAAAVTSEVLAGTAASQQDQHNDNTKLQNTGMFGPGSLLAGFGLLAAGMMLRRSTRRERRRSA